MQFSCNQSNYKTVLTMRMRASEEWREQNKRTIMKQMKTTQQNSSVKNAAAALDS